MMKYERLLEGIGYLNSTAQISVAKAVNQILTVRNWLIGAYIVEYEQNGDDRATYGEALLQGIAADLVKQGYQGLSLSNLKNFRKFALTYPHLAKSQTKSQTVSDLLTPFLKSQTVSSPSIDAPPADPTLVPLPLPFELTVEFPSLEARIGSMQAFPWQTAEHYLHLFRTLPWSHWTELCRIDDAVKRVFYELESVKSSWSIRELKRQINSMLYERVGLSRDKQAVLALTHEGRLVDSPTTILRDPYVLEFLELEQKPAYTESDLEQALIDHLQQFIHELGRDFCFVDRQFRISLAGRHYYLDLLFYHRALRCLIAVDLKLGVFEPGFAGQMNLYLNYLKTEVAYPDENPPVGILLCADKDAEEVHYATAGMDNQLFVSRYLIALPSKEKLRQWLHAEQQRFDRLLQ